MNNVNSDARGRRRFLQTVGGAAAVLSAPAIAYTSSDSMNKPNILLALADDQTWQDSGCYGNAEVKTPNIDRLATQGMRFTRCFTATAMCAPSRQQLYTGIFPVRNGAYPNHSVVKPGIRSIAHYLKDLGYRVGLVGKTHFGPPESFPFERVGSTKRDENQKEAIAAFINRDPQQPYCLIVASRNPHAPWDRGDASIYKPETLSVPPYLVDDAVTRDNLARYYAEITDLDREIGECKDCVEASGSSDRTIFVFSSEQGSQFPFAKWTCYDLGLRTALIVRWPRRVQAGAVANAMVQYVDILPTLIEAAGGTPIENLDGRSFLGVLEGRTDIHRQAVYGVHTTRGIKHGSECYPVRSVRTEKYKYIKNLNPDAAFKNTIMQPREGSYWQSWVQTAQIDAHAAQRVALYKHRPAEEFYDIQSDPYELDNLAGEPRHRVEMDSLSEKLEAWMDQQGDRGIETEMKAFERQPRNRSRSSKDMK